MYRLPCVIEYIHSKICPPAYILTLSRADLPQFMSLVDKIKNGRCKGVELIAQDCKAWGMIRSEGDLLALVIEDVTLRLNENDDEYFRSFLADMTADAPRYDHIDLEFRDAGIDLAVRVV